MVKKPYNPRNVAGGKQHQLNKTNFIGQVVDFLKAAGLDMYAPQLATAVGWMLQSGRFILSAIFVQERKGDAMISEQKVEALRLLTASNLAAIDIALIRLVFYNCDEMERPIGFQWRPKWLIGQALLNELTFEEVKEYKKSRTLPTRLRHMCTSPTSIATVGSSIVIDLDCGFPCEPATGVSAAIDFLRANNYSVPIYQASYMHPCMHAHTACTYTYTYISRSPRTARSHR